MIRYLEHKEIDKKKWDDCIQRSPNGMVYARSWYLDIVAPGWNAIADESYTTVFPLTWRKKYGFYYLYQPDFTQQLGLFSVEKKIPEKKTEEFLGAIPGQYRFIEIQLNSGNTCRKKEFSVSEKLTHHLDLDQAYEKIYASYSENLKRNIRRAEKNKLELTEDVHPSEIVQLFRKNKGKEVSTLGKKEYEMLLQLIDEANGKKLISVKGVKKGNGKLSAGAIFLTSDHGYVFFFSAADEESRTTGAMSHLIDSFIRAHCPEKTILDFEGSMNQSLARFYKSFGSKEVVYLQIKKNNLPAYIRWIKK